MFPRLDEVFLMIETNGPRIVVAMDYDNAEDCLRMARQLPPDLCRLKVGKELFTACGPRIVEQLMALGFEIFLDLKFHDIPTTTAKAVKAAANLGVWMVNVHASGGERMLTASYEALAQINGSRPLLIAVTVLTSMENPDLQNLGVTRSLEDQVLYLTRLSQRCGLDGVVCSAREAATLRQQLGDKFCLVTPGIRQPEYTSDDQRRTLTPAEALAAGSSYLVIGRPITQAVDPLESCHRILASIGQTYARS
jgi:orotidine-5'-phosphate decarboxylase